MLTKSKHVLLLVALCLASSATALSSYSLEKRPSVKDCEVRWFDQKVDHWGFSSTPTASLPLTYKERYFICYPAGVTPSNVKNVFFYTGNEANVELYVNLTGFMWENALQYNAVLVFAEHRYFGESLPFPGEPMPAGDKLKYLNTDQALADYAELIGALRGDVPSPHQIVARSAAFIGFGGSYGGMLCTWLRSKYPTALNGCIAGSAPVLQFTGMEPAVDIDGFGKIMTRDASVAGGAQSDNCKVNVNKVFKYMETSQGQSSAWQALQTDLGLCDPITSVGGITAAMGLFDSVLGFYTMGSYPFPSSYMMMGGTGMLPPYPMRVACDGYLSGTFTSTTDLLQNFSASMKTYFDAAAGSPVSCIKVNADGNRATQIVDYLWGYLSCTTMVLPSAYNGNLSNGGDMMFANPWVPAAVTKNCQTTYGVSPDFYWGKVGYGGRGVSSTATNIVFSNGELDPWRAGGVVPASGNKLLSNPSVAAVIVSNAGHHMDLMFSDPMDSKTNVVQVRAMELEHISRWISEHQSGAL